MDTLTLAQAIFLMPLSGFVLLALFHKIIPRHGDFIAIGVMGAAFLCALTIFFRSFGADPLFVHWTFDWIPGKPNIPIQGGILIDGLTAIMLVVVTLVSFLVHLFSSKYLEGDIRYGRYYASLLLFSTSMLGLVLADNLLYLFIFWELVGLSSYVLIGHWYEKKSASNAAIKAFITTRIGDVGMLIGLLICYWRVGELSYAHVFAAAGNADLFDRGTAVLWGLDWQTLAGLGLFFGAMGKSAQFPLHVWLPDAMEGPTPVSALIHAATMVAAGVYLVGRMYPIFTPEAFLGIAYIGGITALFAATIATVQDDIKRVLAYSTLSQLGYMVLALGVGGYTAGLFHLTTHAFFKAGLFLGSGAVIHAMHHEQLMSKYGGLAKKLPITAATYLICVLAISGVPPLAGFVSKDMILADTLQFAMDNSTHWFLAFSGFLTALLTAYYMFRQFFLTFTGRPRDEHAYEHAHEVPWQMWVPLTVLAGLAIISGYGLVGWFEKHMPSSDGETVVAGYIDYHEANGEDDVFRLAGLQTLAAATSEHAEADDHEEEAEHAEETVVAAAAVAGDQAAAEEHGDEHAGAHHPSNLAHYGAMALSILLAGLGIGIAYLAFYERADGSTRISPALVANRIRPLHTLLWNKYYIDEIYGLVFVGGSLVAMRLMAWFDKWVVDLIVNTAGYAGKISAFIVGVFDNWVVDGLVNGAAALSSFSGDRLSYTQTGRVRNYLLYVILGVVGLSVILMFII